MRWSYFAFLRNDPCAGTLPLIDAIVFFFFILHSHTLYEFLCSLHVRMSIRSQPYACFMVNDVHFYKTI